MNFLPVSPLNFDGAKLFKAEENTVMILKYEVWKSYCNSYRIDFIIQQIYFLISYSSLNFVFF